VVRAEEEGSRSDFIRGLPAPLQHSGEKTGELLLRRHAHALGEYVAEIL